MDKEAEVCHMIEEKEARDLVLRNSQAAEARERGTFQLMESLAPVHILTLRSLKAEKPTSSIIKNRLQIQTLPNAKDSTFWDWDLVCDIARV